MKSLRIPAVLLFVAALVLFAVAASKLYELHEQKAANEKAAQDLLEGKPMGGRMAESEDFPSDRSAGLLSFSGGSIALGLAIYCLTRRRTADEDSWTERPHPSRRR